MAFNIDQKYLLEFEKVYFSLWKLTVNQILYSYHSLRAQYVMMCFLVPMVTLQSRFHYPYVPELGKVQIIAQENIRKLLEITVAFRMPQIHSYQIPCHSAYNATIIYLFIQPICKSSTQVLCSYLQRVKRELVWFLVYGVTYQVESFLICVINKLLSRHCTSQ